MSIKQIVGDPKRATQIFYNSQFDNEKINNGEHQKVSTCSESMKNLGVRLWMGTVGTMLAMIGAVASGLTLGQFNNTIKVMKSGGTMLVDALLGWDPNTNSYMK